MEEVTLSYDEMLDRVEAQMIEIGEAEFETSGFFCGGMYAKTIYIPKGSYLTSKIHKKEHIFILSQGAITIFTQQGEEVLRSPHIDITLAGTRRFARADTDVLWTCIHRTDKVTPEEVEEEVIENRVNPLINRRKLH